MPMFVPTVGLNPEPMAEVKAPEFKDFSGGQVKEAGEALTKAGTTSLTIGQELQRDIDIATSKESDNALADFTRTRLYDPEKGYLLTQGKSALTNRAEIVKSIQDKAKEIENGLGNDVQKMMFRKTAAQRMQQAFLQIDGHAMNQLKVYNYNEAKARLEGAQKDAMQNWAGWDDPQGLYVRNKQLMGVEFDNIAELMGVPKDSALYESSKLATFTQFHTDVLNNMMSLGQTEVAQKYLDANIKEIAPNKLDEIRTKLKAADKQVKFDKAFADLSVRFGGDYAALQTELLSPEYLKASGLDAKEAAQLSNIFKAKENYELTDEAQKLQGRIDEQVDNAFKLANAGNIAAAIREIKRSEDIPEDKKFQYITSLTSREVKTDPISFVNLYDKVRRGEVTATDIKTASGVSATDRVRLLDAFYDAESSEVKSGENYLKSQIISTGPLGSPLPAEHERLYQAYEELEQFVKKERKDGKKVTSDTVYEAAKKIAARYRPSINTRIEDYQTMFPSAPAAAKSSAAPGRVSEIPKRKPGESIDDFLKRTGR